MHVWQQRERANDGRAWDGTGGGGKRGRGQREISCFPVMVGGEEWVDGR